ncbi:schizont membrane associated cytoadherence protein, putative [Plasmodium chabaudi chabaudi]|uniref:Schizont membrane associated cytoadherence protein, putative n=1 Tax=Plasmodium chabaudi chabaudi TaxID=31271 RepID=A0A077TG27_PLACU|nr:schizont membrane associated cytoadherence protein, putative [Plasmodium chabaudi chabaudi]SCM18951.1 schizont membrane associated cytoadherence protein, putative [Plasmodium chabaudi chabaudi]SCN58561.1 schizont membrane associated cytoadherence protein, putative [Plasmodium chabaudi chabaudi]VTZ66193.1 schizont membrane associated cytoadherence protein, putative [Plasmodium chabaudi chabaudi]|eukprot:XP_743168.1 schizont membrane associated cytoadherence protein, putative [Plasmodium chabaudi chabaudi]
MKYLTHIFFFIALLQLRINKYDNNDQALGRFLNIRNGRILAASQNETDENENENQSKKKKNQQSTYAPTSIPPNRNSFPNMGNAKKTPTGFQPQPTQGQQKTPYNLPGGFDIYNSEFMIKLRQNAKLIMISSASAFFLIEDLGVKAMLFLIFAAAALAYLTSI